MINKLAVLILCILFHTCSKELPKQVLPHEIIEVKNPSGKALNEINIINKKMESFTEDFESEIKKYIEINGNSIGFEYELEDQFNFIKNYILSDKELIVRQFAALKIPQLIMCGLEFEPKVSTVKRTCYQLIKPDDIMWMLDENAIHFFGNFYYNDLMFTAVDSLLEINNEISQSQSAELKKNLDRAKFKFREEIYLENPSRVVRANALLNMLDLLYTDGDFEKGNQYYEILLNDYEDIDGIRESIKKFNPNKSTKVGKRVPEFETFDSRTSEPISPKLLRGKYYLIYFWSTSCPPCIAKMKELHDIYDKYENKDFTIISFSVDDSMERLNKFWKEKWPMPWYNVSFGSRENKITKSFEVNPIPNILLVNQDGVIVENDDTFGCGKIEPILSKYIRL